MSLAKVQHVSKARKDPGRCEKCGTELKAGDPYLWFTVGFRSKYKHVRCTNPACLPKQSERESSMLAGVYAAQEDADFDSCETTQDFEVVMNDIAAAIEEFAQQYRDAGTNEHGVEWNMDSIERADQLENVQSEVEMWSPEEDEPVRDDFDSDSEYEEAREAWVEATRDSARSFVDELELP